MAYQVQEKIQDLCLVKRRISLFAGRGGTGQRENP
jgi:hypothetical protein